MIIFIAFFAIIILVGTLFLSFIMEVLDKGYDFEEHSILWYVSVVLYNISNLLNEKSDENNLEANI